MFSKFFGLFIFCLYLYFCFEGILRFLENRNCKKNYLDNRKKCKMYTCRFYKFCSENNKKNEESKNDLNIRLGKKNEFDV